MTYWHIIYIVMVFKGLKNQKYKSLNIDKGQRERGGGEMKNISYEIIIWRQKSFAICVIYFHNSLYEWKGNNAKFNNVVLYKAMEKKL